ncbi:MAG: 16S rRNA (guanine1516-N2)-methyltransferase [Candidatus Azotimanducaceae bacterium]|jgi:16S rRNA (guanine1516-N2)-methyltransferase
MPRYCFSQDENGYFLKDRMSNQRPLRIDFSSSGLQRRAAQTGKSELLLKAIGARENLRVLDCTAGLGVDAFLMAAYGCQVTLIEQSQVLSMMLGQAIENASTDPGLSRTARRMQLHQMNAMEYLQQTASMDQSPQFDVIYIDPMFPPRSKSAEVKGNMQILQKFVGNTGRVEALLEQALATKTKRVVIKRPLRGGDIDGFVPSFQQKAKSSRFDIYLQ